MKTNETSTTQQETTPPIELKLVSGDRADGESDLAVVACNDYVRMGPARSLAMLAKSYRNRPKAGPDSPPTKQLSTLKQWSAQYDWVVRARGFDAITEERKTEIAQEIMESGYAQTHERVRELNELGDLLKGEIYEQNERGEFVNLWCEDVKVAGEEVIDIVRFNAPLIAQFRGVLDDIAKETGGRKLKGEVTGKDGGAIEVESAGYTDDQILAGVLGLLGLSPEELPGAGSDEEGSVDPAAGAAGSGDVLPGG